MSDRCVVCHKDISTQWQDPSTLHGNLHKNAPSLTCQNCHPDHRGPNASLTDLTKADVSHDAFGYALKAHQVKTDGSPFTCVDCHATNYTKFDQNVCATCHQLVKADFMQAHIQAYGTGCLACHDGIDSYGHTFNHNSVAFQLTGKHIQLTCAQCHTGARTIADLKATPQDCNSCHAKDDKHKGQFGNACGACHTPDGWLPASFDHSKFPLTGGHAGLACTSCHKSGIFTGLSSACASCHADPAFHAGLFTGTACDQCHTTVAWTPATYNGAHPGGCDGNCIDHRGASCNDCHTVNLMTATCLKCHDSNTPGDGGGGGG